MFASGGSSGSLMKHVFLFPQGSLDSWETDETLAAIAAETAWAVTRQRMLGNDAKVGTPGPRGDQRSQGERQGGDDEVSLLLHMTYDISRIIVYITNYIFHITYYILHITYYILHITYYILFITYYIWHMTYDILYYTLHITYYKLLLHMC